MRERERESENYCNSLQAESKKIYLNLKLF